MKFKSRELGQQGLRPSREVLAVAEVPDNLFNPELELSHKEFTAMLEKLEQFAGQERWRQFAVLARDLKLLFPGRVATLQLDHAKKEAIKKAWTVFAKKNSPVYTDITDQCQVGAAIISLFPEEKDFLSQANEDESSRRSVYRRPDPVSSLWSRVKGASDTQPFEYLLRLPRMFQLLEPTERKKIITPENYQKLKDIYLEAVQHTIVENQIKLAAIIRLLFPEKYPELGITKQDIQKFKRNMRSKQDKPEWQAAIAVDLKMMTWSEVKVGESGQIEFGEIPYSGAAAPSLPKRSML